MSQRGVARAKRGSTLTRAAKAVLVLLAKHKSDDGCPFGPHPGTLLVESGLSKRKFDSAVQQLQKCGLVALEVRVAEGTRRTWYQFKRQPRIRVDVGCSAPEPVTRDLFHVR